MSEQMKQDTLRQIEDYMNKLDEMIVDCENRISEIECQSQDSDLTLDNTLMTDDTPLVLDDTSVDNSDDVSIEPVLGELDDNVDDTNVDLSPVDNDLDNTGELVDDVDVDNTLDDTGDLVDDVDLDNSDDTNVDLNPVDNDQDNTDNTVTTDEVIDDEVVVDDDCVDEDVVDEVVDEEIVVKPAGPIWTVRRHDTLGHIAKWTMGKVNRWREIYELNTDVIGDNPNLIKPGWKLVLPSDAKIPDDLPIRDVRPPRREESDDDTTTTTGGDDDTSTTTTTTTTTDDGGGIDEARLALRAGAMMAADFLNILGKNDKFTVKIDNMLLDDGGLKINHKLDIKLKSIPLIPKPGITIIPPFPLFVQASMGAGIELGIHLLYDKKDVVRLGGAGTVGPTAKPIGGGVNAWLGGKISLELYAGFDTYGIAVKVFASVTAKIGLSAKAEAVGGKYKVKAHIPVTASLSVGYDLASIFSDTYTIGSIELLNIKGFEATIDENGDYHVDTATVKVEALSLIHI